MATADLLPLLPDRVRKGVYIGYLSLGAVGSAALAFYAAVPELSVPFWLTGGLAALGSLSIPGFAVAAANVNKDKTAEPAYEPEHGVDPDVPPNEVDDEPDEPDPAA